MIDEMIYLGTYRQDDEYYGDVYDEFYYNSLDKHFYSIYWIDIEIIKYLYIYEPNAEKWKRVKMVHQHCNNNAVNIISDISIGNLENILLSKILNNGL